MKLFPKPKGREVAWVGLASPQKALELFTLASDLAGSGLTTFELVAKRALDFTKRHIPGTVPPLAGDHAWLVLMEISSGRSARGCACARRACAGRPALERGIVEDAALASSLAQAEAFWRIRETMPDAQAPEGVSIKHDISVPVAAIPAFIEQADKAVQQVAPGARVVCFGHMGDGNLHYNVTQPEAGDGAAFMALYRAMNDAVHAVVRSFDGSISAEHGIGQMKRDELAATAPPVAIAADAHAEGGARSRRHHEPRQGDLTPSMNLKSGNGFSGQIMLS